MLKRDGKLAATTEKGRGQPPIIPNTVARPIRSRIAAGRRPLNRAGK
jgi:hypothetical protein